MRRRAALLLFVSCGTSQPTAAPTSAPSASSNLTPQPPLPEGKGAALVPAPSLLKRKASPRERFEKDTADCSAGKADACRSLAERYAAAGPRASCGVPRERPFPSLKRAPGDFEQDRAAYERTMGKLCADHQDAEACALLRSSHRIEPMAPRDAFWAGLVGDPGAVGIRRFRASGRPSWSKILDEERRSCLSGDGHWACAAPRLTLFTQEKPGADGKLPPEIRARAEEACAKTRDCNDVYMVLDKSGYSPAELAPVREAFAKTLVDACLEGECTCGDAARYVPAGDTKITDLAILGCENGEAEGCYALARAYESGAGVPKSEEQARALYDVACPALRPERFSGAPVTDYSPRACDRLAEIAIGGAYPGKDRYTAKHYALSACRDPSFEVDHGPCVRLGMLWATRTGAGQNAHEARMVAMGEAPYGADRPHLDDCKRPSVERECNELREALKTAR